MEINKKKLIEEYLETIELNKYKTKKLFAIGFIGLIGIGKSFVAQKLEEKLGIFVAANDKIRRFLNQKGFKGDSPVQNILQEIAEATTIYLYKNRVSHIIDADLIKFHLLAKKISEENGADFFLIKLICPEEIIISRLEKRKAECKDNPSSNFSRADMDEYFRRKEMHLLSPIPETFFTINTSGEIDLQISELAQKLNQEGVI